MALGMSWGEVLLLLLAGWTAVGTIGVAISFARGEHTRAKEHMAWIGGVWVLYLTALVLVSLVSRPSRIAAGQEQCFHRVCFAVIGVDRMPGFLARNGETVVRVTLRVTNHSTDKAESDSGLQAYLVDSQGRRWPETRGLEGVRLDAIVPPRTAVVSQPVFKVAADATNLNLVLTHGPQLPGTLVLGDPDSLFHSPVLLVLDR
jgi:hypothetical protein